MSNYVYSNTDGSDDESPSTTANTKDNNYTLEYLAANATKEAALRTNTSALANSTTQCPHCLKRVNRMELSEHLKVCVLRIEVCRYIWLKYTLVFISMLHLII